MPAADTHPHKRPAWRPLASRFTDERECLASFIALETAEIIEGAKPANLFTIANRRQPCGRNLYLLWKKYGRDMLNDSGLTPVEMVDRGSSILLLVYCPRALEELIARRDSAAVLRRCGYDGLLTVDRVLARLRKRLRNGKEFPHEIGVVLGYPLKDVVGFLGWAPIPYACQGPWKIYGNPRRSLELADCFRNCRGRMARRLASSTTATSFLHTTSFEMPGT